MAKRIPIGVDNFSKLVDKNNNYLFVDKTLFIKELIDKGLEVSLITRPRRWGKTLNMSMLQHFFAPEVNGFSTQGLFEGLKIASINNGSYLSFQGKNPVIFISFKNIKPDSWELFLEKAMELISTLYGEHAKSLFESKQLLEYQKNLYKDILERRCNQAQLENSLKTLSECLFSHYGKKVIILIDEYDSPLNATYGKDFFDKIVDFFKTMFGSALKGNSALEKGIITGILRLSKNRMLSDINNLKLYSFIEERYSTCFGFSEEEVQNLFQESNLNINMKDVQRWYNGYNSGNLDSIYNPWSILNCIDDNGKLKPYWIKTGDETLLKEIFLRSNDQIREEISILLSGGSVHSMLDEYLSFDQIKTGRSEVLWSLLWALGYLKTVGEIKQSGSRYQCQLKIPNAEIETNYRDIFLSLIDSMNKPGYYYSFIKNLALGNVAAFTKDLEEFMLVNTSFFDFTQESHYHIMLLTWIASLKETHDIQSNKENGLGRPDIILTPREITNHLGVILEVKHAEGKTDKEYERLAEEGLKQINEKKYDVNLKKVSHIKEILKVSFIFHGKQFICKTTVEKN